MSVRGTIDVHEGYSGTYAEPHAKPGFEENICNATTGLVPKHPPPPPLSATRGLVRDLMHMIVPAVFFFFLFVTNLLLNARPSKICKGREGIFQPRYIPEMNGGLPFPDGQRLIAGKSRINVATRRLFVHQNFSAH